MQRKNYYRRPYAIKTRHTASTRHSCLLLCLYGIRKLASATPWTSSRTSSGQSAVGAGAGLIVLAVLQEEHPLDQRNHLAGFFPHHESDTGISGDVSVSPPGWCIRARRFMMLLFVSCLSLCLFGIRVAPMHGKNLL